MIEYSIISECCKYIKDSLDGLKISIITTPIYVYLYLDHHKHRIDVTFIISGRVESGISTLKYGKDHLLYCVDPKSFNIGYIGNPNIINRVIDIFKYARYWRKRKTTKQLDLVGV